MQLKQLYKTGSLVVYEANFAGLLRLQNPKQPQQAPPNKWAFGGSQIEIWVCMRHFKLIRKAKYLALQTVFTFPSVLKPGHGHH